jgi:hypothetical protein
MQPDLLIPSTLQLGFIGVALIALAVTVVTLYRQLGSERDKAIARFDAAQSDHDEAIAKLHEQVLQATRSTMDLLLRQSEKKQ